ncbi:MAG: ribonuclease HII [Epsilonproteobacteria bacterium]|nr:ribonuclease HII [Campylobacterota bacterium]
MTIGVDEAGRGSWAGPVVVGIVQITGNELLDGIVDSKVISENKRELLYDKVIKLFSYSIGFATNKEIDRNGIIKATNMAINRAIGQFPNDIKFLLIDGQDKWDISVPHKTIIKGDQKIKAISAASIVAKVWRDRYMRLAANIYKGYKFEKNKGYGTKEHLASIKKLGICDMHRRSYKPIKDSIAEATIKKSVLLHTCCAPCASGTIEQLKNDGYNITLFFYDPNISPESEYIRRSKETERLAEIYDIGFIKGKYDPLLWNKLTEKLSNEPELGRRCTICYHMRMSETAKKARGLNFDAFTTTLTISPHKDAKRIYQLGNSIEKRLGIKFIFYDFKKKNGLLKSIQNSKKYNFYRQNFCGCVYSKNQ